MTKITKVDGITTISDKSARVTIGFVKHNRMVEVAVSYCAPADKFKRKIGRELIQYRFISKNTIALPLGNYSEEEIIEHLQYMFLF